MVVSLEVIVQLVYLHNRKNLIRELIGKLNGVLAADNEMRNTALVTVKSMERPLKFYVIACVSTVVSWTSLPLMEIFRKSQFYYTDYRVPAALSREPFSVGVFAGGVVLESFGSLYTIFRKVSLDIYTIHFILLMTAQYRYLRIKFVTVLRSRNGSSKGSSNGELWEHLVCGNGGAVRKEMRLLTRHHSLVVEMATLMKKLFAPNIGLLYINNVFRFCFLSFMIVTSSAVHFGKVLIILYTVGALIQLYILCFCIQQLLEASASITDDVFHEKWYAHDMSLQRVIANMSLANKLECRLSRFRNIDLTLPSFMSILNQAYSVCLLFLKARRV
ncbi:uncharacterized protein LOC143367912 isoform X2 [Andrena cerasifolii]